MRIPSEYAIVAGEETVGFLEAYNRSHRHPVNRALHAVGIPTIVVSLPLFFWEWKWALALFVLGWILQFVGHVFEGKPPAFFSNPIFLLVGPYWWIKKTFSSASHRASPTHRGPGDR